MKPQKNPINIKNFLPHRAPMLMADKLSVIKQDYAEGSFHISPNCIFLEENRLSEAGLIEHAAQICSAVIGQKFFSQDDLEGTSNNVIGYISAIKKVDVFGLPAVTENITTKASLISHFDAEDFSTCTLQAQTFINKELLLDCTLNFLIHEL